jgi:ATP-binding protein involved in chromosome partitioning
MFRKVNVPVLGIVENMSTFVCPHCGEPSNIFGHGGARAEAARLGVPFLGEVPLTIAVRELSDEGRPVVVADPSSPAAEAFLAIGNATFAELERHKAGMRRAPQIVMES